VTVGRGGVNIQGNNNTGRVSEEERIEENPTAEREEVAGSGKVRDITLGSASVDVRT
jgi:hypothetical protein